MSYLATDSSRLIIIVAANTFDEIFSRSNNWLLGSPIASFRVGWRIKGGISLFQSALNQLNTLVRIL
ncbi:hypothetical protein NECAME_03637 [Necator americanus]|uniref:Uncharacterized protein n=1 Tax=Necator americanus TaxID=51031 RepID=W2T2S7_NECAM|nr:hypothetical protein NECAME_03637 [Necator americanus]ETN75864.1 hypothetical protein NECAME_03637 [Necator americanus]